MLFKCVSLSRLEDLPLLQRGIDQFSQRSGLEVLFGCYTTGGHAPPDDFYRSVKKRWDAALLFLPGGEGLAAAGAVRAANPALPLIWISDNETLAIHSYRLHARRFLCPPVDSADIAKALLGCLAHRPQARWA